MTKHRSVLANPFGMDGLASIVNQKWMNKIYKLRKVDGRITSTN